MDSPSTENSAREHHQHIQPRQVNKLMMPEHRVNYEHQMQQDTKILATRSCYKDQLIAEMSGMEQNKQERWPELQHIMRTSQSLPQRVGCLLRMAEILRNNLPKALLLYACSPSPTSLFSSQTPSVLKNTSGCPHSLTPTFIPMSSWPMLILVLFEALIASTFLTPHITCSPLFTCLDSILYILHPPGILRGYSMVLSHATPFSIHHQPSVIFRVLKIYSHLLLSLVPS